jgi:hypothetical protein
MDPRSARDAAAGPGRPARGDGALEPVLDDSASVMNLRVWVIQALVVEAITRDALGEAPASGRALERALDLAESDACSCPSRDEGGVRGPLPDGGAQGVPARDRAGDGDSGLSC